MPEDNFGNQYNYKSSGTNSQGNHYCARDFGQSATNSNSYHHSNQDGSYYSNSDGSKYYNNGKGDAWYIPPASSVSGSSASGSSGPSGSSDKK